MVLAECFQNLSRLLLGEARVHDRRLVIPHPGSRKWEYAGHRLPAKLARIQKAGELVGQRFRRLPAHDLFDGETMVSGIGVFNPQIRLSTWIISRTPLTPFSTVNGR